MVPGGGVDLCVQHWSGARGWPRRFGCHRRCGDGTLRVTRLVPAWCLLGCSCRFICGRWSSRCRSFWRAAFHLLAIYSVNYLFGSVHHLKSCGRYFCWRRGFLGAAANLGFTIGGYPIDSFWIGSILVLVLTGLYTVLGGMKAVVYTEAIQTVILVIGSVLITYFGLKAVGGWGELRNIVRYDSDPCPSGRRSSSICPTPRGAAPHGPRSLQSARPRRAWTSSSSGSWRTSPGRSRATSGATRTSSGRSRATMASSTCSRRAR